jgi:hypothetical protein
MGAVGSTLDHNVPQMQAPEDFVHGIVRVFGVINEPFRMQFSGEEESVHVSFGAAVGAVSPSRVRRSIGKAEKLGENFALEFPAVEKVVALDVRIADVVERKLQEAQQRRVVEIGVARISKELFRFPLTFCIEAIKPSRIDRAERDRVFRSHSPSFPAYSTDRRGGR